jgi:hypothetical protein
VTRCFYQMSLSPIWTANQDLIDHRYFFHFRGYRNDDYGNYTCGLARNAVADQLILEGAHFDYLLSLDRFITNKSTTGFAIEFAVLESIQSNGLAINVGIGKPMELKVLMSPPWIDKSVMDKPVLYRPEWPNFKPINGLIILIKPAELSKRTRSGNKTTGANKTGARQTRSTAKQMNENTEEEKNVEEEKNAEEKNVEEEKNAERGKKKLLMFPLQITIAPEHKNSREMFFRVYGSWIKYLSEFDVQIQFLWITPERRELLKHEATLQRPAHEERYIPLVDVNKKIWKSYEQAQIKAD